jgi:hypothetical protein
MNKTDYLRNALADHVLRGVVFTPPTAWFLALFSITPTSSGGGTEVAVGAYSRQAVTFSAATSGESHNTLALNFPTPTLDWGPIPGVALFDALTAGSMLYFGVLGTPKTVYAGEDLYFPVGYFSITES